MNRMDRLFALLLQLQAHGMRRAQDLALACNVSLRTIYRDVQALTEAGVPVIALPGQGYALTEGYFLPPLTFTGLEAGVLALGADHVARTLDAPFRAAAESAQAKLANALTAESRHELRMVQDTIATAQLENLPAHKQLKDLRDAIAGRLLLQISYHSYGRPAPEEHIVEPYGLLYFGRAWQLLAYCTRQESPRLFRLDRIDTVRPLDRRFEHGSAARRTLNELPAADAAHQIVVRVSASALHWIREEEPPELVEQRADGDETLLIFRVQDPERFVRWLLRWAGDAQVVAPVGVRQRMLELGRRVAEYHTDEASVD